jgi:hypothetical protein
MLSGYVIQFGYQNNPFVTKEYNYQVTLPMFFYSKGQAINYPSPQVFLNISTTNTVGDMFIAGSEIQVGAELIDFNATSNSNVTQTPFFYLGFQNAVLWGTHEPWSLSFDNTDSVVVGSAVDYNTCCTDIEFPTEGNDQPILFGLSNGTSGSVVEIPQNFTSVSISIQPSSVYITQGYNRVNEALTYGLFFFGVVESANLSRGLWDRAFPSVGQDNKSESDDKKTDAKPEHTNLDTGGALREDPSQDCLRGRCWSVFGGMILFDHSDDQTYLMRLYRGRANPPVLHIQGDGRNLQSSYLRK